MSVLYGFDLVVARASLRPALVALERRLDARGTPGCLVLLPGDEPLRLACEGQTEDGPVDTIDLGASSPVWLRASLWLPVDEPVLAYLRRLPGDDPTPKGEKASIGYLSIFVALGTYHTVVSIGAVTSSMSYLFEASLAVRSEMLALLAEADGRVALLSRQPGEPYEPLHRPGVQVELGGYQTDDLASVDAFAERAIAAGAAMP